MDGDQTTIEILNYVLGRKEVDIGAKVTIKGPIVDRKEYLIDQVKGKSVIHIGFADHAQVIPERVKNRTWLHGKLERSARRCVGIDIDRSAVHIAQQCSNLADLYVADITNTNMRDNIIHTLEGDTYDLILLPSILEHILSVGKVMEGVNEFASSLGINSCIVTVPNAYSFDNLVFAWRGYEDNNTDHKYYFSPMTLTRVMWECGWKLQDMVFSDFMNPRRRFLRYGRRVFKCMALMKSPLFANTVIGTFQREF